MSEELAFWISEIVSKPKDDVTVTREDLMRVKIYLDSGDLERKVTELLAKREEEHIRNELARAAALQIDAEMAAARNDKKCPSNVSTASVDGGETASEAGKSCVSLSSEVFNPTNNEPKVDFLSFISTDDAFLMIEERRFPLAEDLSGEQLGYPLGVAFDETLNDWLICDRNNHKILRMNIANEEIQVLSCPQIKNPSAVIIYEEGKSAAVLCSEDRYRQYSIYLYSLGKPFIRAYATHKDEIYAIRHQMRGLAKSLDNNLISIEIANHGPRRLRVFKKDEGAHSFELKGAQNPSFLATYRGTVAVSDLGVNKVFIYHLDDRYWDNVDFVPTSVIDSHQKMPIDRLANDSGFAFVSGMQFDVNGFLLIGDAKGHTIKLYDTEYEFLHRVSSDFPLPFMSSFHVTSSGDAMILDVHADQKLHWAKMKSISEILPWQHPGSSRYGNRRY